MSFDLSIVDGDLVIGQDGDLQKVENTTKLIQDLLKLAITPTGSNPFHPWYGSPISKSLIGMSLDASMMEAIADGQLTASIKTLQSLQRIQFSFQTLSASEQIAAISDIHIERNQVDPRYFTVVIKVLSKDMSIVTADFTLKPTL